MYDYFQNISILTNNLFNTTNYYYRQIISGFENDFNNENQIEVLNNIKEIFKKEPNNIIGLDIGVPSSRSII